MKRFWNKVKKTKTCWEWKGWTNDHGYGLIRWKGKRWRAHRLIFLLMGYPLSDTMVVMHKCDNRKCIRPSHLIPGTKQENNKDCAAKGRNRNQWK